MKKDIAKKWVKALRSGKYKQGKTALKVETKTGLRHCCLGVLCELYQQDRKKKHAQQMPTMVRDFSADFHAGIQPVKKVFAFGAHKFTTVVPPAVQKWAGLADAAGEVSGETKIVNGKRFTSLAELNDAGVGFKRIASVIEDAVDDL